MKKILILSWRDIRHPNSGGAEIATFEHAKYWMKNGYEVVWFASGYKNLKGEEVVDGVRFIRRGSQLGTVFIYAFLYYVNLSEKPDLVVDQIHGMPFFTPLYARKSTRLAYIHETAGKVWFMNHLRFPLNYIYGIVGYISEPIVFWLFYRNVDFMTVSESTKKSLRKFGICENRIRVIYNGFSKPKKVKKYKKENNVLIYLGALAKDKGVEDVIYIYKQVKEELKDCRLWIVGKGEREYEEKLERMVKNLGLSNVKFWGFVDEQQKFELLNRAEVMINPSRHEGWGLTNIEASSAGTPVIAYDVSGCRDSVKNGYSGYLVKFGDREKMVAKTLGLINNRKKYKIMSENSKKWADKFSWGESTKKSLELIKNI